MAAMLLKGSIMGIGILGTLFAIYLYDNINNEALSYRYKPNFSIAYFTGIMSVVCIILGQTIK